MFSFSQYRNLANPSTYMSGRVFSEFDKLIGNFDFFSSLKQVGCRVIRAYAFAFWEVSVALEQPPRLSNKLTLWDVLEHMSDPISAIKKAKELVTIQD
jgi:hypothetical protein